MRRMVCSGVLVAALVGATLTAAFARMDLPETVDITKVSCADLVNASPLDRAATVMFYWGYAAAKAGVSSFKTSLLRSATAKLTAQCKDHRSQTIMDAMRAIGVKAF
jgi:hypothetical protein